MGAPGLSGDAGEWRYQYIKPLFLKLFSSVLEKWDHTHMHTHISPRNNFYYLLPGGRVKSRYNGHDDVNT